MNDFKSYNKIMKVVSGVVLIVVVLSFMPMLLHLGNSTNSVMPVLTNALFAVLFIGLFFARNKMSSQATSALETADQKIQEFQNKTFSSPEEKEKVKQALKVELITLKNQIHFIRGRREMDDKIMLL